MASVRGGDPGVRPVVPFPCRAGRDPLVPSFPGRFAGGPDPEGMAASHPRAGDRLPVYRAAVGLGRAGGPVGIPVRFSEVVDGSLSRPLGVQYGGEYPAGDAYHPAPDRRHHLLLCTDSAFSYGDGPDVPADVCGDRRRRIPPEHRPHDLYGRRPVPTDRPQLRRGAEPPDVAAEPPSDPASDPFLEPSDRGRRPVRCSRPAGHGPAAWKYRPLDERGYAPAGHPDTAGDEYRLPEQS